MNLNKQLCLVALLAAVCVVTLPADTGDDDFGTGFSSFGSDTILSNGSGPSLSGSLRLVSRVFPDLADPGASELDAWPVATVRIGADNDYASLNVELRFDNSLLGVGGVPTISGITASPSPSVYLRRLIREASVWMYGDPVTVEAGLLRRVWGKGDELHVVDVLNPTDYSDLGSVGYVDSQIAVPMVIIEVPFRHQGLFELAYVPILVPDEIPAEGRWMPAAYADLQALAAAGVVIDGPPTLTTLDSFQIGARVTDTFGPLDLGLVYYYGFLKQPSIDWTAFVPPPDLTGTITLTYDRVHVAGGEAAAVIGLLNLRGEVAYYATLDTEGDDPSVANASLRYLGGFDINAPINNLNLNVQVLGAITLASGNIDANGPLDFEHDADGIYSSHLVAASLRDTYFGERLTAEISGAWRVETGDFVVRPALTLRVGDDLEVRIGGTLFEGDADTFLGQYDGDDFVQIDFAYNY